VKNRIAALIGFVTCTTTPLLAQGRSGGASPSQQPLGIGARQPAFAADGRLAVSVHGHIWTLTPGGEWTQMTSGGASDREPSWSFDGSYLVFSSDRSGKLDIWRVFIGAGGKAGTPEQLTHGIQPDGQPVVAQDGRLVFTRGRGAAAQLWVRSLVGAEYRLTSNRAAERSAALSPDGSSVAYIALDESGRHLRLRNLSSGADELLITDPRLDALTWGGDAAHIAFTSGRAAGVYLVDIAAKTVTQFTDKRVEAAWARDGSRVALTEVIPEDQVGYNGDPDRLGDRTLVNIFAPGGALWVGDPASVLTSNQVDSRFPQQPREARNADAFDQAWMRTAELYYAQPDERRATWEKLRAEFRPRALHAADDDALKTVLHEMFMEHPPYRQPATGQAAVSSANPVATQAGLTILRAGGNVVDAAVAVSFALGVVEPDASGPGGYGQILIFRAGMERPQLIEFMTRVPEDAGLGNPNAPTGRASGAAVANVPGTVAAMYLAWQRYGSKKVAWADLLAPAIHAARDGYPVSEGLATTLTVERESFMQSEGSRALFFKDGLAPRAGDTLKNPDLAWTLEQIAKGGADAFYKGEIAKRLVADLRAHGNAIKLSDMWRYFAADRNPVSTTYRGYTIYSSAPPVDGGATLAARLNLLEHFPNPRRYSEDAATTHAMIAAWQLVPSTRNRIADPSLWPVNTEPFTNKDTARIRWTCFDPTHALNVSQIRVDSTGCAKPGSSDLSLAATDAPPACEAHGYDAPPNVPCRAAGTTAFVIGDADGNVVAATQTLGTWGGGFYVTPGLGFLYNDKLNSYGTDTTVNGYGVRLPFARHGSTLAPTIVFEGRGPRQKPVMAVGAAGNNWITSAVYETLAGMIDARLDPQAALEQPRFQIGGGGGRGRGGAADGVSIQLEDGFAPSVVKQLESMGYRPQFISLMGELREGYGAALRISDGKVTAGADPRRAGAAGAIPARK
jgi:gamma-glutamyltranspeptidase/glutathione hydrolase